MLYNTAPIDTVGYHLNGRPLTAQIDRSDHFVHGLAKALQKSGWFDNGLASPDVDAVIFYLLNQAAADIRNRYDLLEPVPKEEADILSLYNERGSSIALRLAWYVFVITTREARHNQSTWDSSKAKVVADVSTDYPDTGLTMIASMFNYTKSFPDSGAALGKLLQPSSEKFQLGPFCRLLRSIYYRCSWGGAFGGPKWGTIADALYAWVTGAWSAEMFADTAFTLAHNTAPIFNKGMLYNMPGGNFIELLDVQRAGMIPQWLNGRGAKYAYLKEVQQVKETLPHLFEGEVDWHQVKALGAVGCYDELAQAKPPKGCLNKSVTVDAKTTLWVKDYQRAA